MRRASGDAGDDGIHGDGHDGMVWEDPGSSSVRVLESESLCNIDGRVITSIFLHMRFVLNEICFCPKNGEEIESGLCIIK